MGEKYNKGSDRCCIKAKNKGVDKNEKGKRDRRYAKGSADLRGLSETKCQLSHNSLKINVPGGIK
jgi:hypothetical protein